MVEGSQWDYAKWDSCIDEKRGRRTDGAVSTACIHGIGASLDGIPQRADEIVAMSEVNFRDNALRSECSPKRFVRWAVRVIACQASPIVVNDDYIHAVSDR
jgi:hypothetical protein